MSAEPPKPSPVAAELATLLASGPAQRREDSYYTPTPQTFWVRDSNLWLEKASPIAHQEFSGPNAFAEIMVITWNIDMLVGGLEIRMAAALDYLQNLVSSHSDSVPVVILLQEMAQSDLHQIRSAEWVQQRFCITDYNERNWLNPLYGTTILVDRRLRIKRVFRVPWISKFERDGLFVDLVLQGDEGTMVSDKVLRICNAHLESLVADPPVRPLQLAAAAEYMHKSQAAASILAGDLNAIEPFDRTLHTENDLKDAYLELGGKEDSDEGYTWGYQVPQWMRDKFGCSRMDKILFCGNANVTSLERIGIGVKVAENQRQAMRDAGEQEWVTDHYGVVGVLELGRGYFLSRSE